MDALFCTQGPGEAVEASAERILLVMQDNVSKVYSSNADGYGR
jgi:hypothetical protein